MSILGIGLESRRFQSTPGCRNYINPFLSPEDKQQILIKKQQNQYQYRSELLQQINEKRKEKQLQKKKLQQQEAKHQRQFYAKIQQQSRIKNKNNQRKSLHNENKSNNKYLQPLSRQNKHYLPYNYQQAKDENNNKRAYQVTFPSILPSSIKYQNYRPSQIRQLKSFPQQNLLANHSLIQIGQQLRSKHQNQYLPLNNYSQYKYENNQIENYVPAQFKASQIRYQQLKQHLKQKTTEIYDLLKISTRVVHGDKSKRNHIKKRLKTQPLYVLDHTDDQKPTLGLYNFYQNRAQDFYQLPRLKRGYYSSSLDDSIIKDIQVESIQSQRKQKYFQPIPQQNYQYIYQNPQAQDDQYIQQIGLQSRRK